MAEAALLYKEDEEEVGIYEKLKEVIGMATPMVPVAFSQYLFRFVSMVMVSHLGELALSGVALATSLANVTGFSLIYGLAGALETLCGQAYGAKQYQKLGSYTCNAMICLSLFCVPVSLIWVFVDKILILVHQDPQVSKVACSYSICLIPSLYGFVVYQSLVRYFQSQGLIGTMVLTSSAALCLHIPLCWFLVYKLGLGIQGAALSIGFSYWVYSLFLWLSMKCSSSCEKTRIIVSKDVFSNTREFLGFAVPSAMMSCIELWSSEILIILSGFLPNSKLETSILSICLTTKLLHFYIVYAVAAAASTKVSNELGAGNPRAARVTSYASVMVAAIESIVASTLLYLCRNIWGRVYSNEKEILDYTIDITPLLCLTIISDSLLTVLCGIARGTGWQRLGAIINIGAYYCVGVPIGILFGFGIHMRGKGLWVGVLAGGAVQSIALSLMIRFTNWNKEAVKARERMVEKTIQANEHDGLAA